MIPTVNKDINASFRKINLVFYVSQLLGLPIDVYVVRKQTVG